MTDIEPMLLLQIAEQRRQRLMQEAERERLVRTSSPRSSSPRSGEVSRATRETEGDVVLKPQRWPQ